VNVPEDEPREGVLIQALADMLMRSKTGILYSANKFGIEVFKVRGHAGQDALAISPADAKRIIADDTKRVKIIKPEELLGGE